MIENQGGGKNVAKKANVSNYQAHKALKEWREKGKIAN